jgi:hypothetical protein
MQVAELAGVRKRVGGVCSSHMFHLREGIPCGGVFSLGGVLVIGTRPLRATQIA